MELKTVTENGKELVEFRVLVEIDPLYIKNWREESTDKDIIYQMEQDLEGLKHIPGGYKMPLPEWMNGIFLAEVS